MRSQNIQIPVRKRGINSYWSFFCFRFEQIWIRTLFLLNQLTRNITAFAGALIETFIIQYYHARNRELSPEKINNLNSKSELLERHRAPVIIFAIYLSTLMFQKKNNRENNFPVYCFSPASQDSRFAFWKK